MTTKHFWYCAKCRAYESEDFGSFNDLGVWYCNKCIDLPPLEEGVVRAE